MTEQEIQEFSHKMKRMMTDCESTMDFAGKLFKEISSNPENQNHFEKKEVQDSFTKAAENLEEAKMKFQQTTEKLKDALIS
jgi:hypothetical protein